MHILIQELKYAIRQLRKSPGFTLTALLTLALGIGASTAIFTVVDSVLLKPLSYPQSGQLVVIWSQMKIISGFIGPNLRHEDIWKQRATAFSDMTAVQHRALGVSLGMDHPKIVGTIAAYPNMLQVLGVRPLLGRDLTSNDAVQGRENVAIITYEFWQNFFHGDPNVLGKTIRLANVPTEIIGVLPPKFQFPQSNVLTSFQTGQRANEAPTPQIVTPLAVNLQKLSWWGDWGNQITLARLKPGVSIQQAQTEINAIEQRAVRDLPGDSRRDDPTDIPHIYIQPMHEAVVDSSSKALWMLLAAVLGVMLIACVNLANTQLARATSRQRDTAIRSALGADSWRLLLHSLAESVVLAGTGGAAGILLAKVAIEALRNHAPLTIPRLAEVQLSLPVLLFALALTMGSVVLFGMLPALRFLRIAPQSTLQQSSSRTLGIGRHKRIHSILIGAQVFGCTSLLLVTGLFAKSLLHLLSNSKGFHPEHVVATQVDLPSTNFDNSQRIAFDDAVLSRLRALPGVQSAGLVSAMPLEGESWFDEIIAKDTLGQATQDPPMANFRWISSGYFETMQQPLVRGRFFDERDKNLKNVIISEKAAKTAWPGLDPVGRQMRRNGDDYTVVGVVADARNNSLKLPPANMVYLPYGDRPPRTTYFMVRSAKQSDLLIADIRKTIWGYNPDVTIARIKSLDSQVDDSLATERLQTLLLIAFGSAALLLAMLGIYGILSYTVANRTQEIGVRIALGASRSNVYRLTMGNVSTPVAIGLVAGWLVSLLTGRVITSTLYGVQNGDIAITLSVLGIFLSASLLAALLPAKKAASIEPMQALRTE